MTIRMSGGGGGGGVIGWPVGFFGFGAAAQPVGVAAPNAVSIWGFALGYQLKFSNISILVDTADAGTNSDVGIYTQAGALIADVGAQAISSTDIVTLPIVQGVLTLNPGLYMFALTLAGSTLSIWEGTSNSIGWIYAAGAATSSGGQLPATIPAQTVSVARNMAWFSLE